MGVLVIKGSVPGANGTLGKVRIVKWVRLQK
jgi:ribosomal protein L3